LTVNSGGSTVSPYGFYIRLYGTPGRIAATATDEEREAAHAPVAVLPWRRGRRAGAPRGPRQSAARGDRRDVGLLTRFLPSLPSTTGARTSRSSCPA